MKDEIRIIDPCVDQRWDEFVKNHPWGWIVHLSGWKKVLESTFPHMRGHYFALIDKETDTIKAGLPVYEVRSWLTGNRLVSIPFATLSDPLVSDKRQSKMLMDEAIQLLERLKLSYLEIRTLNNNFLQDDKTLSSNHDYINHYLDLSQSEEQLWKKLKNKTIGRWISKARKHDIKLRVADNEQDVFVFYQLYAGTRRLLGLPAQPYNFFKAIYDAFFQLRLIEIHLATIEGKTIGGHFYFKFNRRMSAEAVGDDFAYRNIGINHFLYWEGIHSAYASGYQTFDFGRTSIYNPTLMDFKKRWGTIETDLSYYYEYQKKRVNATSRETSIPYKLMHYICHNLPGSVQPAISHFCYRHLG
ncbi:MAG: GNAT family N-acetyltransferase [Syntrophomonas sp.]